MSYSRETTHVDYSSMKMGDPYSIFMVECHLMLDFYLRNRTCITCPHRVYGCFYSADVRTHGSDGCQAESGMESLIPLVP